MDDQPNDLPNDPPNEPAAGGTITWSVAPDYGTLLAAAEAVLDDVDRALARLDQGTYGICEVCGAAIDHERLAARPTTRRCGDHPAMAEEPGAG